MVNNDGNAQNVGQKVILPSTYCGGPRYMFERQQDAMACARKYGRPSLFVQLQQFQTGLKSQIHSALDNILMIDQMYW